jgi:glycosyltransferase involved in cell wall biosynthesis
MSLNKVCFFYLDGLAPGGYPRDMRWLADALTEIGVQVTVLARPGPEQDGLENVGVVTDPASWSTASHDAELLHVFGFSEPAQLRAARVLSKTSPATVVSPLVHLMREHVKVRAWKKLPAYLIAGRIFKDAVGHFFSEVERSEAQRFFHPRKSFIAGAGLFPVEEGSSGTGVSYLLFFGRNDVHQKGIDSLIDGYERARARGLEMPLVIGGRAHGDSEAFLRDAARRPLLAGHLRMVGETSERERSRLMRGAHAFVFLSRWDGPPRPIREAISLGVPPVVTPGTNMGDVIAGNNAGLVTSHAPDDVAAALLRVSDAEHMEVLRNNVPKLHSELSWSNIAQQYLEGYEIGLNRAV